MRITIFPACALFAWIFVLTDVPRLPTIRREPERLTVWLMFLAFALVFTTGTSPLRRHLDGFAGITEFSTWLLQCLVTAYSLAALALLELWNYEPARARRRIIGSTTAVTLVLVVMAVLFFMSNVVHAGNHDFVRWYGSSAYFDAYLVLYLVTFMATNVEIARLCRRFARMMTRSWLRTGLRKTAAGALVSLVYVADRLMDIVVAHMGLYLPAADMVAQAGAGFGCSMLVMVGLSLHMWGPRLSTPAILAFRSRPRPRVRPDGAGSPVAPQASTIATRHRGPRRPPRAAPLSGRRHRAVGSGNSRRAGHPHRRPVGRHRSARGSRRAGHQRPEQPHDVAMNNEPADLDAELLWRSTVSKYFAATNPRTAPVHVTTAQS